MKILERENIDDWNHVIKCHNCNSKLQVEAKDLAHTRYDGDPREAGYDSFHASCAVCGCRLNIPSNSIPKLIQHEVKNRTIRSYSGSYFDR